jgi:hypothetical protein
MSELVREENLCVSIMVRFLNDKMIPPWVRFLESSEKVL